MHNYVTLVELSKFTEVSIQSDKYDAAWPSAGNYATNSCYFYINGNSMWSLDEIRIEMAVISHRI